MAAPPGNNFNPAGRPRQLGTEIERLVTAAGHVQNLLCELGLRLHLDEQRGRGESSDAKMLTGEVLSAQRRLGAEAETILRLVAVAQSLAAQLGAAPVAEARKRRRRGSRPIGASAHEQAVAQASIWLDRVLPDDLETN